MESETFIFVCPHCGQRIEAEPDWVGMEVECPTCGKTIVVQKPPVYDSSLGGEGQVRRQSAPRRKQIIIKRNPHHLQRPNGGEVATPPIIRMVGGQRSTRSRKFFAFGGVAAVICIIGAWTFAKIGLAVSIPLSDMQKSFYSWFYEHHDGRGAYPPRLVSDTLEFKSGLLLGKYEIPLELQSKCLTFEFCSTGETDKWKGDTTIDLSTVDLSDMIFIRIRGGELFVNSRRNDPENKIRISSIAVGKWESVRVEMKQDRTEISISGKTINLHPLNGIRFANIGLTVGKSNLLLKDVRSYPTIAHRKAAGLYDEGFSILITSNGEGTSGVRKMLMAARAGLAEAQEAYALFGGSKYHLVDLSQEEMCQWFRKAARQGRRSAQTRMGWCCRAGAGTKKDEREAYRWFLMAAQSGDHEAEWQCGSILLWGDEVKHDIPAARKWLIRAQGGFGDDQLSEENKGKAYEDLAYTYIFERDFENAEICLYDAIRCGNAEAKKTLKELRKNGWL